MAEPQRASKTLALAYVVYLACVAYLVWNPSTYAPGSAVVEVTDLLLRFGLPATTSRVEFALNVVMFVPLSLLGAPLFRRWRAGDWVLVGFCGSLLIEVVQRLLLPTRSADPRDVVSNTLGALVGIVTVLVLRAVLRWLRRSRSDRLETTQ